MIKKILFAAAFLLCALLVGGCGSGTETEVAESEESSGEMLGVIAEDIPEKLPSEMEGSIALKENLPDRDIVIPDYLKDDEGAEQAESGEGEAVHMTGEEQTAQARQIGEHIESSINEVLSNKEYYPNITAISVKSDCTEFNVTLSGRDVSLYETVLPMSLCIVGDRFQLYQGKSGEELMTVVNYIDEKSGEVFSSTNSEDIK